MLHFFRYRRIKARLYRRYLDLENQRIESAARRIKELKGLTGIAYQEAYQSWDASNSFLDIEIEEPRSDIILLQSRYYDIALPRLDEKSPDGKPIWEEHREPNVYYLTSVGRELMRDKIHRQQERMRATYATWINGLIGIGGLVVAALALLIRG